MAGAELLITDLDGTLLGDDEALIRFRRWWRAQGGRMRLVYASGRFCDSIEASIRCHQLPHPDAIIGGVGSEIGRFPSSKTLAEWEHNWSEWDALEVRALLADFAELTLQPLEYQSNLKTSYHVYDASRELLSRIQCALESLGIFADLIYSSNRDLDVLPRGMNKGAAAAFLANHWGVPLDAVVVAGDSGNDRSLFLLGSRGIIVANAQPELAALAGPSAYLSNRPFADGVLDGMRHWLGMDGA